MDPKEIHEFEQNMENLLETLPNFLFNFYTRLIGEGFNDEQAMAFALKWLEVILNTKGNNDRR